MVVCLQHLELSRHCAVLVWNGRDDHAADSAQGHRTLQPDGRCGLLHTHSLT